jgi:aminoglycoside 3-N-acetyltransferase
MEIRGERVMEPPFLPSELRADFVDALGDAEVVLLQSAPRAIGHVVGGIDTIVEALLEALGPRRTLVVPTFTFDLSDPSTWEKPAAPRERWEAIRAEMPIFDPARSTPRQMGALADRVWRMPGARRSSHPIESIAALGPAADEMVKPHPVDDPVGPRSPWARLVERDASIVLLGVGLERCTILHHAERMAEVPYQAAAAYAFPVSIEGERQWLEVDTAGGNCSEGFPVLLDRVPHRQGRIGAAKTLILSAARTVEVAREALGRDPFALLCHDPTCGHCTRARTGIASPG